MDDRPVVWDRANRKHIGADHPEVVGRTAGARWLVVIWIDQPEGRYPIHVRATSNRIIRRLINEG